MKNNGLVQGSKEQSKQLIINHNNVYVHTNITPLENGLYEYEEVVYTVNEYIELMQAQITDTELALVEIYETLGGAL